MMDHLPLTFTLVSATILCSLVAGFLLAFAIVVMPGIKRLNDREFIQAFQVMDGEIQDRQPIFLVVWVGSVVALVASAGLSIGQLDEYAGLVILFASFTYLLGVQLPTFTVNIPLNNKLQTLDADAMNETEQEAARKDFEPRWNQWNAIRTVFAILTSVQLILLLFRL